MPETRRLEHTKYPGIYKRIKADGKLEGYQIKPRFPGYSGPKSLTRKRLTDARKLLDDLRQDVRKGLSGFERRCTLAEAVERYRSEELPKLAASERRNRERQLKWWEARRGASVLRDVTRSTVRDDLRLLREQGNGSARPVKYATENRYKAALSAVLSSCVDWEWIQANPLHTGSRRKKTKGEQEEERDREVSVEEWERLWPALQTNSDRRLYALTICALASGAREGELMGMERANLRLDPMELDPFTGQMRPGVPRCKVTETKSGEARTLYFPGLAGELLRARSAAPLLSRYVWAARGEDPRQPPVFPMGPWRYAKKKAKLRDFRFHDLRHEWACMSLLLGVSELELMLRGGWRSPVMVRRYSKQARHRNEASFYLIRLLGLGGEVERRAEALPR
ncbi:MAG TPA: tyrosine-type recombinase/integrase [Thermoanaerobaculia bacterium]|nr:tyrosine-type recombinase/integrase [Thermoanaerobaculia bacterium]